MDKSIYFHALKYCKCVLLIGIVLLVLISSALFVGMDQPIIFESLESQTLSGGKVFNKITFNPGFSKDIWLMQQSHFGKNIEPSKWDRLAIVVEKNGSQKTAKFYQLKSEIDNPEESFEKQKISYKVACFICHSNGPRLIRPNFENSHLSLTDRFKIGLMNFRIKSYGPIYDNEDQKKEDLKSKTPFRYQTEVDNEILNIKSCVKCHNDKNFFGRGYLRRQNLLSIQFMLKNKSMPPSGHIISKKDSVKLELFLKGF